MGLEEFWFVLIAVLWGGLLPARGVRLRRRDAAPVPAPRRARARPDVRIDRTGVGRQRGVARGRRRRDVRRLPGLVRDDVLRLLHRAAADPRPADRPRGLVRVAREARHPALAGHLAVGEHDRQRRRARSSGEWRWRTSSTACRWTPRTSSPATSSTCSAPTRSLAGLAVVAHLRAHGATYLTLRTVRRLLRTARPRRHGACRCPPRSSASRSSPGPSSSPTIATAGASSRRPSPRR